MLASLSVAAALLFGPRTPEAERHKKISPLFDPKPGAELVLDRLSLLENTANPSKMKGYIWVKPPKGQCLIVRADRDRRDQTICKPTPINWKLDDLDGTGRLKITVLIQAEWDEGITLIWNSNYRVGNFVDAGDKKEGFYSDIVIKTCKATDVDGDRSILLESFEGRRWRINLPEFDTPVRSVDPAIPNLLVNIDSKKNADGSEIDKKAEAEKKAKEEEAAAAHGGKKDEHGATDEHGAKKDDKKPAPGGGSVLGALLTKGFQTDETKEILYNLPVRGAYRMESGLFTETGSPKGMNGECRYMFKNAPGDPKSGAIECHDTDTLDNVYVHVTCFSVLKERLAPKKEEGKKK